MRTIETPHAPAPAGHYSQAIVHDGLVYVAGQLAIDPETGEKRLASIEEGSTTCLVSSTGEVEAMRSIIRSSSSLLG